MSLEAATYISQLVTANPAAGDNASQGDDHLRLIKETLQNTFPNASRAFRFFATDAEVAGDFSTDVDDMHKVLPVNATAAARTVTLGSVTIDGWWTIITKYDSSSNTVTIDPSGSTTINGASSLTLTNQYESMLCWWDNDEAMWRGMRFFPLKPYYSGGQDIPFSDIAPSANAKRVLAATTATDFSEHTIAAILEFISTSLARGDILMRGASFFDRLEAGTSGKFLQSQGTGNDLIYGLPLVPARAYAEYVANADTTATIPVDDTVPQIGEGTEILSLNITPIKSTSVIRVRFQGMASLDAGSNITVALFKDGAASAVRASTTRPAAVGQPYPVALEYEFSPGSTNQIAFTLRAGSTSGALRFNGTHAARHFGGAAAATLIAEELFTA